MVSCVNMYDEFQSRGAATEIDMSPRVELLSKFSNWKPTKRSYCIRNGVMVCAF